MAFPYPEFHGREGEDVVDFVEQMELACITNHVVDEVQVLRLMGIFLKGDARNWLREFEAQDMANEVHGALTLDRLKEALLERFQQVEEPGVLWQELSVVKQGPGQSVDEYGHVFAGLWDRWCNTLKKEVPPLFVKKSMFMDGLLPQLKVRVDLKNPKTYDDAVRIAKERKQRY